MSGLESKLKLFFFLKKRCDVFSVFYNHLFKKKKMQILGAVQMPAPLALTFCPYPNTSFPPPRTGRSRQPPLPASWIRSAGCPGASQT